MPRRSQLLGQTFGLLTVIAQAPSVGHTRWKVRCECGTVFVTRSNSLKNCAVKSCGCTRKKAKRAPPVVVIDPHPRYSTEAALALACALGIS